MNRSLTYVLVLCALLLAGGCSKHHDGPVAVNANAESMHQQGDESMEEMPDDGQGVIYF